MARSDAEAHGFHGCDVDPCLGSHRLPALPINQQGAVVGTNVEYDNHTEDSINGDYLRWR